MKNSTNNRPDIDRTVRAVWWRFATQQKPVLLVKVTRSGAHLVWYDGARGVRHGIEPMDNQTLDDMGVTPRKAIAGYRRLGKKRGITKRAATALTEAYGAL